jgi:hypothetical protein
MALLPLFLQIDAEPVVTVAAVASHAQVWAIVCTAITAAVALGTGLRGWYDGALSSLDLLLGGVLLFASVGIAFIPAGFPWTMLALLLPILFLSSSIRVRLSQKRTGGRIRDEEYAKCRRVLARDPRNAAALGQLAELLEADGHLRDALDAYETCAQCDVSAITVQHRMARLRERVTLAETGQGRCVACGTLQPLAVGQCFKCGRVFDPGIVYRARLLRLPRYVPALGLLCAMLMAGTLVFTLAYAMMPLTPWLSIATGLCLLLAVVLVLYLVSAYRKAGRDPGAGR